jgi:hypothetical protein
MQLQALNLSATLCFNKQADPAATVAAYYSAH